MLSLKSTIPMSEFLMRTPNGAADKPRKARKPQAFSPGVGLIRVVVRRKAPNNHADADPPPRSAGAKRPHYK